MAILPKLTKLGHKVSLTWRRLWCQPHWAYDQSFMADTYKDLVLVDRSARRPPVDPDTLKVERLAHHALRLLELRQEAVADSLLLPLALFVLPQASLALPS